ncbi:MAG: alpha/beta hydrolase, partial [Pseudomonadota bacterium]|nr:alpha/beta hydrolase [Pseudomonadota bacterium]
HAICEDYRAAYTIDIAHDDADEDREAGSKLRQPLSVLWASDGIIDATYGALAIWQERAVQVTGRAFPGSHYFPEERPEELADEIRGFFLGRSLD